jgi:hypothetical protein
LIDGFPRLLRFVIRIEFVQGNRASVGGDDTGVKAAQLSWLVYTAGMCYDADFIDHVPDIIVDPLGLALGIETSL